MKTRVFEVCVTGKHLSRLIADDEDQYKAKVIHVLKKIVEERDQDLGTIANSKIVVVVKKYY